MNDPIIITGSSSGIGLATVKLFIKNGYKNIIGIDLKESPINSPAYTHYQCDVSKKDQLPDVNNVAILINNAGSQDASSAFNGHDLSTNLGGTIFCTEKYGLQENIKAIVNQASVSAHNGAEFPEYTASKGGVLAYTKWTAKAIAKYGAVCNSLSFGGVSTDLNKPVMEDSKLWDEIMEQTPLKKWVSPHEAAQWIYFMAAINRSCTGQDIIIDNGEFYNHNFVWT